MRYQPGGVRHVGASLLDLRPHVGGACPMEARTLMVGRTYSVAAAANLCGVTRLTIIRYCNRGVLPQAYRNDRGRWVIHHDDLAAAGLLPDEGTPGDA